MSGKTKLFAAALILGGLLCAGPVFSAEESHVETKQVHWSFSGPFGTYDVNQLRRGFQVFREVCASCHAARLLAFRNLEEPGGPEYSEGQVKLLASEYFVADPEAPDGERPAVPADHWPSPFLTEQDARDANNGVVPPDFSVLAKARGIHQDFPYWALNYFTAYQEGGPDYIYNLLINYADAPHDMELQPGQYYNAYTGGAISMPPPLEDGLVDYAEGEHGAVPETVDQYSKDVSAFMYWMADPHMVSRKEAGFRVILFLILFAGLMYAVKRRVWNKIAH